MHRAPDGRASTDRRHHRRWLLLATTTALVIAAATTAFVLRSQPSTRLVLSTSRVKIGETYSATASGFSAREGVRFSWTGPTNGVMDVFPADSGGRATHGGILERDPPGHYSIIATGLISKRAASAALQVVQADPVPAVAPVAPRLIPRE
ncbi:MAG: hypothetical protein ACRDQU_03505 [Pseudonocardiaceae bacterium]